MFAVKLQDLELTRRNFGTPKEEKGNILLNISTACIIPNPNQPRKMFSPEKIDGLCKSILAHGLISPVSVRSRGNGLYELIAGERRYRACLMAGLKEIPAYVMEASDKNSALMALIENVQRQDLHFFEEAAAIERLMTEHNLTQEQISASLGKKQSTVANKLRLLRLAPDIREKIIAYALTERHARALLRIEDSQTHKAVVETAHQKKLTVKKTEELIDKMLSGGKKPSRRESKFALSNKIYINSVKALYNSIKDKGVNAEFNVEDRGDKIVLSITINKI